MLKNELVYRARLVATSPRWLLWLAAFAMLSNISHAQEAPADRPDMPGPIDAPQPEVPTNPEQPAPTPTDTVDALDSVARLGSEPTSSEPTATSGESPGKMQLWAWVEQDTLFVRVDGFPAQSHMNLYIDTDPSAVGYAALGDWISDANFRVWNEGLVAKVGSYTGSGFNWNVVADAPLKLADGRLDVAVSLKQLGLTQWTQPIGIGVQVLDSAWAKQAQLPYRPQFAKLDAKGRAWDSVSCRWADELSAQPSTGVAKCAPDVTAGNFEIGSSGMIIPAYLSSESLLWPRLKDGAAAMKRVADFYVVVSGAASKPPVDFTAYKKVWDPIRAEGGRIFGYIHPCTDCFDKQNPQYLFDPLEEMQRQVDQWVCGYRELDGIWIDEFYPHYELVRPGQLVADANFYNGPGNAPNDRCFVGSDMNVNSSVKVVPAGGYFARLRDWIKATYPHLRVVGNAGGTLRSDVTAYADLVDVLVSFESSSSPVAALANGKKQLALIHGVPDADAMIKMVQSSRSSGYSHVYVTHAPYEVDGKKVNVWDNVATYLDAEVGIFTGVTKLP